MSAGIRKADERSDYFGMVAKSLPYTFLLLAFWNEMLHRLGLKVSGVFWRKVSETADN